jgi:hypothetical protein
MAQQGKGGYIALHRAIFDDPLFSGRPDRLCAFEWLIAQAAWKPCAQALGRRLVHVERGQLACTIRSLATAWRWPHGNVQYLLKLFQGDEKILCQSVHTRFHTRNESRNSYRATLITICNYEKYQGQLRASAGGLSSRHDRRDFIQDFAQLPLPIGQIAAQQTKPTESSIREEEASRLPPAEDRRSATTLKPKPPHGVKNRTGTVQWFDYGTPDWKWAAELHEQETGAKVFPKVYRSGRGNWFKTRTPEDWKAWGQAVSHRKRR